MGQKQGKEAEEVVPKGGEVQDRSAEKLSLVHRELRALPDELFSKGTGLVSLDISHNKLQDSSLNKLVSLEKLTTLVADSNRFQKFYLPNMPNLTFLSINSNKISDLEGIAVVLSTRCPQLKTLSLTNNPCCPSYELQQQYPEAQNVYRCYIIGHFKNLKTLDYTDVTEQEREKALQLLEDIADGKVKLSALMEDPSASALREEKKKKLEEERKKKKKDKKEKKKAKKEKKKKKEEGVAEVVAEVPPPPPPLPPPLPEMLPPMPEDSEDEESGDMPPPPPPRDDLPAPDQLRDTTRPPPPPPPPMSSDSGSAWSDTGSSSNDSDEELNEVFQRSTMHIPSEPSQKTLVLSADPPPPPPPSAQKPQPAGNIWSSDEED
eukprot:TRINITY_DN2446_c1_g1_i1.p1 TRINITY_DN2446_c1_g1~~TRINITY_DN2446_c1_g1_i1.p1  ORF type:complete len:395 (+),score=156.41 TRINITY_DN2446_c1_g1_i1:55-1185(+)